MLYQGLLMIVLAASCHAYKAGPPVNNPGICDSMTPSSAAAPNGHGASPKDISISPFEVVLSNTCYKEGQTIKVKLQAKDGTSEIEGLFVQARKQESAGVKTPQGTFQAPLPDKTQRMKCTTENDVVGHAGEPKKTSLEFSWTAPANSGNLEFLATIVQHKDTFWVGIKSAQLEYDVNCTLATTTTATTTTTTAPTNAAPSCIVPLTLTLLMLLSTIFSIIASK